MAAGGRRLSKFCGENRDGVLKTHPDQQEPASVPSLVTLPPDDRLRFFRFLLALLPALLPALLRVCGPEYLALALCRSSNVEVGADHATGGGSRAESAEWGIAIRLTGLLTCLARYASMNTGLSCTLFYQPYGANDKLLSATFTRSATVPCDEDQKSERTTQCVRCRLLLGTRLDTRWSDAWQPPFLMLGPAQPPFRPA